MDSEHRVGVEEGLGGEDVVSDFYDIGTIDAGNIVGMHNWQEGDMA